MNATAMTDATRAPKTTINVPGPIAIAVATGRPELARLAVLSVKPTPTLEAALADYAESVVRDVLAERAQLDARAAELARAFEDVDELRRAQQTASEATDRLHKTLRGIRLRQD